VNESRRGGQTWIGKHDIVSDTIIKSELGMSVRDDIAKVDQRDGQGLTRARTLRDATIRLTSAKSAVVVQGPSLSPQGPKVLLTSSQKSFNELHVLLRYGVPRGRARLDLPGSPGTNLRSMLS